MKRLKPRLRPQNDIHYPWVCMVGINDLSSSDKATEGEWWAIGVGETMREAYCDWVDRIEEIDGLTAIEELQNV